MEGVIFVLLNHALELHTTRSWDFIGFSESYVRHSYYNAGNVIIGMFDSGIRPESDSFSDEGLEPPPKKWKGKCQTTKNFTCNNKIIGARYYSSLKTDIKCPRDTTGHGTQTASIATGREVLGASYYGLAKGVARGGAPSARIAVYKVCWSFVCYAADILAAFEDAIADGVDIISISFGGSMHGNYFLNPTALGSLHALKEGIVTIGAAGNYGPERGILSNSAPWMVTVAASSIDRKYVSPDPKATILFTEVVEDIQAPYDAGFSSRGPNLVSPNILKPDLTAPGVNILAAWPSTVPVSEKVHSKKRVKYNKLSGTSASCPHVTGVAAYVKATDPNWSPAAIKSALMTTAYVMDPEKHKNEKEFAYGSGLITL
ncbi:Subtilisin-like protease [Quillaja saponaria]|uniref:Subtilisin-like protease n=1 Tax=Quillaja saponaria TaxID=32244 RepID=A0AAD7LWD2_QUISA|nr:Subtilisin-like protease [Quillaja saponaria]